MWCVMRVRAGEEAAKESFVKGLLPETLDVRCFHLTRNRRKKYGGEWRTVKEKLLPGYVFIVTDRPEEVCRELDSRSGPRLLFGSRAYAAALEGKESALMERLVDEKGEIAVSKVKVSEDGTIQFLSGPLLQVESLVRRVNLHRRIAEIETDLLGRREVLHLGIEIEG